MRDFQQSMQSMESAIAAIDSCKLDDARDAKRYRWLRLNPTFLGWDADYRPDEVDRAVDNEIGASHA